MNTGIFQPDVWTWLFGPGIGTNLGASLVWVMIAGVVGVLIWPPVRQRLHRLVDRKLAPLHDHLVVLRAHAEHQTRIVEDHYHASLGHAHPHAGKLDSTTDRRHPL